jgi:hypothetical protein
MDYPEEQSQEEYTDQEEWQDNFLDEQREAWDENYGNYPQHKALLKYLDNESLL